MNLEGNTTNLGCILLALSQTSLSCLQVLLLARLHHKNLVGLVGYSAERGQHMLLYSYMSNGSLASHLYG